MFFKLINNDYFIINNDYELFFCIHFYDIIQKMIFVLENYKDEKHN